MDAFKQKQSLRGLSQHEAAIRLQAQGYNELPAKKTRAQIPNQLEIAREPIFLLLIGAGVIYLVLGDPGDALMLLGFVIITMAITIFQERKAERVLESLRDLSSPRALVIRDGYQMRIPGREVVKKKKQKKKKKNHNAADGELIEAHDLLVDESLLTGESIAIANGAHLPGADLSSLRKKSGSM